jgi:PAS domain S-box-containing protein
MRTLRNRFRAALRVLSAVTVRSPYLILLYSLLLTAAVGYYSYQATRVQMASHFASHVREVQNAVVFRMQTYVNALIQARGFFLAHPNTTPAQFHTYAEGIDVLRRYPGIQGIGYAVRIPANELGAHEHEIRASGHPNYRVWPAYPRSDYYAIVYLEPQDWRNKRAIGYDMFTEPTRRAAMEQARDTGRAAATGRVVLVQETETDIQPGFLVYVPIYRPGARVDTVEERRAALTGFVYSPFRAGDLFGAALKHDIDRNLAVAFQIYDGPSTNVHALLYEFQGQTAAKPSLFSQTVRIEVAGHPWTLRVYSLPGFFPQFPYLPTLLILGFGTAFSLLLFRLVLEEERRRGAAETAKTRINGILESIKDAFFSVDPQWRFTYVNREAGRLLGHKREALLGKTFWETFPDAIDSVFEREAAKAMRDRVATYFEEYYRPLKTWFEVRAFPSEEGLSVYFSNINERKRSEEEVRNAQERFRAAFANASVGMTISSLKWRYVEVNDAFCAITGYSRHELVGRDLLAVTHPADREQNGVLLQGLLNATMPHFELTKRLIKKTGEVVWVQNSVSLVRDKDGQPSHFVAISQDITERKRVEESLAAEKERLAVTLYSIGDGVITADTEGRVVLMNKVAEQLTGWTQAEAVGRRVADVFPLLHETTRQPLENPIARLLHAEGEATAAAQHTILVGRDDQEHVIADSGAPIRDHDGKVIGAVLVFRDITQQRRMEEEIMKTRHLESIGMLAGGIAHDFNNILTAILGNIALAKLYYRGRDKVFDILTDAERAFEPARELTQQLLTFAKGGMPIKKTASIAELVTDTVTFGLRGSNVRYEFAFASGLWAAEFDTGQMNQVINNLVINAKQAMPDGGIVRFAAQNVEMTAEQIPGVAPGKYVKLTIADTGVGIAAKHLTRIFDPYFTTKQQGSGLGLATTYSIMKKHGGHIEVASEVGVGTTFTLYLPVSADASPAPPPRPSEAFPSGEGRVLVLDDEEAVRKVAANLLRRLGYEVDLAETGEGVLSLYTEAMSSSRPYDAVILDLTIPGGMGGKECMQHLRRLDPNVSAIVSSGYSTDPVMAEYKKHGFRGVVAKPYQIKELSETVWRVIHPTLDQQPLLRLQKE